jgi:2,3-bisphosphoglycerate-independent phosphoglycerate mutase
MKDPITGEPHTAHTILDVTIIVSGTGISKNSFTLEDGRLADVAPTLLELTGIAQPPEMTGHSLLKFQAKSSAGDQQADESVSPAA